MVMTDYKMWGSLRVAKSLGIVDVGKAPHPTETYRSSGKWGKAGSPKMIPVFKQVPERADNLETELQQNRYRIMLGELGLRVTKMQLQITVRDGGLYIAKDRGIYKNTYMIPVKILPDDYVKSIFTYKENCLKEALEAGNWEEPCTDWESWDGIRCKSYCDVWDYCPKGELIQSIGGKE